jgi:hypothetical protein
MRVAPALLLRRIGSEVGLGGRTAYRNSRAVAPGTPDCRGWRADTISVTIGRQVMTCIHHSGLRLSWRYFCCVGSTRGRTQILGQRARVRSGCARPSCASSAGVRPNVLAGASNGAPRGGKSANDRAGVYDPGSWRARRPSSRPQPRAMRHQWRHGGRWNPIGLPQIINAN